MQRRLAIALTALVLAIAPSRAWSQTVEEPIKDTTARQVSRCIRSCCMTCLEWSADRPHTEFGIKLQQPAQQPGAAATTISVDATTPLVIFVHGWNASAEDEDSLLKPAQDLKMDCGTFR